MKFDKFSTREELKIKAEDLRLNVHKKITLTYIESPVPSESVCVKKFLTLDFEKLKFFGPNIIKCANSVI